MVARYRMPDCRRAAEKGAPRARRNCGRIAMHIPIKDGLSIAWTRRRTMRDFNRYLPPFPLCSPPLPREAIRGAYRAPRPYVCMSQCTCTCASTQGRIRIEANEYAKIQTGIISASRIRDAAGTRGWTVHQFYHGGFK